MKKQCCGKAVNKDEKTLEKKIYIFIFTYLFQL